MIRLGLVSFSDGRERVHRDLLPDIQQHERDIKTLLEETGEIQVTQAEDVVHSNESAQREAKRLASFQLDGAIFNIPVFAFPNYVIIAAELMSTRYLLLGPHDARYPGLTGLLAAGGALSQLGIQHERLWVDLQDKTIPQKLLNFSRAAATATRLRGQVYGLIGGRSIGMYTGAAAPELWQKYFGVDVDHVDESEIVRRSGLVPPDEVKLAREWLKRSLRGITFDGKQLTGDKLDLEVRAYVALKDIVRDHHFDFVGLKCHYDMSEFHVVQCIGATFLNDPYDWTGRKEPVALACEADSDGALTMQILRTISGTPSCLLDVRFFDREKQIYVMPNCGAAPTWFARRSTDPRENLAEVDIVPSISKYAGGGAHIHFDFAAGPMTFARLTRSPSGYRMVIIRGDTVEKPSSGVAGASASWPHAFVRLAIPPETLVQELQANHLHAVAGDHVDELLAFCRMSRVESVVL